MKHIDIAFDGQNISLHVDTTVDTPLLRALQPPLEFDPTQPWHVLTDKAYNFQYGWNPSGFISLPGNAWIWVRQIASPPEMEVYQRPPASPAYAPIFGTAGSSPLWRWSGSMTHNVYAILNPLKRAWSATYEVYVGDNFTGAPLAGYGSDSVTLDFLTTIVGDFDDDGYLNCDDVNELTMQIASGSADVIYDLTRDGVVNTLDLDFWLGQAGAIATSQTGGNPFLLGDANLDGVVDGQDFTNWNTHKFLSVAEWCAGDFNADGVVDGVDFTIWNTNKFRSSTAITSIPEFVSGLNAAFTLLAIAFARKR